jgi:hypothetical protein
MTLPDYFLADLPPEAPLTSHMLTEACLTLRRNRERYLAPRATSALINLLAEVGGQWLQPDFPLRRLALAAAPAEFGFSAPTLARGLDAFFRQLTHDHLHALLLQELGQPGRLDGFGSTPDEAAGGRSALAVGPEFLVHIAAGNLPVSALHSMVLGVLLRAAQFVKCSRGGALLPRLFAHSLYQADPKLGACLELAVWPGGAVELEAPVFATADCVTVTGSDETLAALRLRVPARARFVGYGHRVSLACVCRELLSGFHARQCAQRSAADIAAWNQRGCLSPHAVYVETGGAVEPEHFAELLAQELEQIETAEPRGPLPVGEAATIAARRAFYEVRAAHSPDTRLWCSPGSTNWTVVYEADPLFQASCGNRFIYVKALPGLAALPAAADAARGQISTIGLAAPPHRAGELALALARWGVTRVCPLGRMQEPPLAWRHDGRPALGDLVTWTDWER